MSAVEKRAVVEFQSIPVGLITVQANTRKDSGFEESEIGSLANSIREVGILEPLLVRPLTGPHGTVYVLVLGERRLRAAKMLGLEEVPCRVMDIDTKGVLDLQITENLQRVNLSPLEEAQAVSDYIWENGVTQEQAGKRFGKDQSWVSQRLALLELSEPAKALISRGIIKASHAEVLKSYEKTAPKAVASIVMEMSDSGRAIPVASLATRIEDKVKYSQKLLQSPTYSGPGFDIAECLTCSKVSRVKASGGVDGEALYCADEKCFSKKEHAVKKAEEQAWHDAHPGVVLTRGKPYGTIEEFWLDNPGWAERHKAKLAQCQAAGCENLKQGCYDISPNSVVKWICLNPECWKKKDSDASNAQIAAERKERVEARKVWARQPKVGDALLALSRLPDRTLVFVVGNLVLDAVSGWRPDFGALRQEIMRRIGWEGEFAVEDLRGSRWSEFAAKLEKMHRGGLVSLLDVVGEAYLAGDRGASLDYLAGIEPKKAETAKNEEGVAAAMEADDHEGDDESEGPGDGIERPGRVAPSDCDGDCDICEDKQCAAFANDDDEDGEAGEVGDDPNPPVVPEGGDPE